MARKKRTKKATRRKVARERSAKAASTPTALSTIPVSGRYVGRVVSGTTADLELDLRIDVDQRHAQSPVMNKISGDIYQSFHSEDGASWKIYLQSWIVREPTTEIDVTEVRISGEVEFWNDPLVESNLGIRIPRTSTSVGPAKVTISSEDEQHAYSCEWKSNKFRQLDLEIDICDSVNTAPLLPSYDTHGHNDRPASTPQRVLTLSESYDEAGIGVGILSTHTVIDDSAPEFQSWSPAELHDVMETQGIGTQPAWTMWGLMAGSFDNPAVGGIMFDAASQFGGAGKAPERQGFAVFRDHSWFNDLVAGSPSTQAQQATARKFLYTWVHEAGHAFNFLHSWDKSRPDSLSWMNYDWRYDDRNGSGSFWKSFAFRFDDEELIHLRHGNRAAVIMGGDSWASGGHAKSADVSMLDLEIVDGKAPLELLFRGPERFDFMEPVIVELRLRNLTKKSVKIDSNLHPEFGTVTVFLRKPSGQVTEFDPLFCKLASPSVVTLQATGKPGGQDRHSTSISLTYGKQGFYFDSPGIYTMRAIAHGPNGSIIPSNSLRIQIGVPTREDEGIAQDYFTPQVGLSLYFGGSQSPSLQTGMQTLEKVAGLRRESRFGAIVAAVVADSVSKPFFRLVKSKLTQTHEPDLIRAIQLFDGAVSVLQSIKDETVNLVHRAVAEKNAQCKLQMGDRTAAREELSSAKAVLKKRSVKSSVLSAIALLESAPKRSTRKSRKKKPRRRQSK